MKNKKMLVSVLGVVGLLFIISGVAYAWFSYAKEGVKENTIKSGSITFHYQEGNRNISLDDAMPMTDAQGKVLPNYFEFDITSSTSDTVDIPYYITARKSSNSDNIDSIVKVYLTKVDGSGHETQVFLGKYSELNQYVNSEIDVSSHTEKLVYNDLVYATTKNYNQKYRMRMWIADDTEFITQSNGVDTYPYQDKHFTLTVNVYSNGDSVSSNTVQGRKNVQLQSVQLGTDTITSSDGIHYAKNYEISSGTSVTKTLTITPKSEYAEIKVEEDTSTGMLEEKSDIQRLSTSTTLEFTFGLGTTNYIIKVISEDKTVTETYYLSVTVELKQPVSFATDDWATIVSAARAGNVSVYTPNSNGKANQPVRAVNMGSLGTHYIRVANTTPCTSNQMLETSCGFVIEFVDVITGMKVNGDTNTNLGGYPASAIYDYLNNTVLPALPEEIRNAIIPTTVVSSHGPKDPSNFTSTNQKLYLLDIKEVFGTNTDNYYANTRQLDYYQYNNTPNDRKKDGNQKWWLRSSMIDYAAGWYYVDNGTLQSGNAVNPYGIAPAFRIELGSTN